MKYELVKGFNLHNDGQLVGETLNNIREKHGGIIKSQFVVDESQPDDAPLHECFEWDNDIAANEHRKAEASKLIRSVRVVTENTDDELPTITRAFLRVETEENGNCYMSSAHVMSQDELRQQVISDAVDLLIRAKSKLKEFRDLERFYTGIETVEQELLNFQMKKTRTRNRSKRAESTI